MTDKLLLTDERKAIIDAAYREHLAAGLSTEHADFETAEDAVTALYAHIGKSRPHFARFSSPLGAELCINLLEKTWPDFKEDQLGDQLGDQLWGQIRGQLGDQLRDQLWGQPGDQLRDQLWGQLGDQLWGQLRDQLWDQLRDQLWGSNLKFKGTWFAGSQDYYWMWLDGGRRVGAVYPEKLNAALDTHLTLCRSVGWFYPFDGLCILTDRPERISFDEAHLLHSETGPALQYRDGYTLHAWHGTRVPAEWIESPEAVNPADVLRAENVEQRAAGAAILGWPRMLSELDVKVINDSGSPDVGQLIELTLPGLPEPGRFLKAECPRNGTICEGVPRTSDIDGLPIETAVAAQAWRIGDPQSEYEHPTART